MTEYRQCELYLLRYVPDAVKDEFVNLGVVLLETEGSRTFDPTLSAKNADEGGAPENPHISQKKGYVGHPADSDLFTDVRFTRDWRRVRCLDPEADVELLESFEGELRRMLQSR